MFFKVIAKTIKYIKTNSKIDPHITFTIFTIRTMTIADNFNNFYLWILYSHINILGLLFGNKKLYSQRNYIKNINPKMLIEDRKIFL